MSDYRWGRRLKLSPHINFEHYRAAAHLVNGYGHLAFLFGYHTSTLMQMHLTVEHAELLRKLAGPHGAVILAAWRAKRK